MVVSNDRRAKWCKCGHSLKSHFRKNTGEIKCTATKYEFENNYKDVVESPCPCSFTPPKIKIVRHFIHPKCKAKVRNRDGSWRQCLQQELIGGYCHFHYKPEKKYEGIK